jgi:hypothetical protein
MIMGTRRDSAARANRAVRATLLALPIALGLLLPGQAAAVLEDTTPPTITALSVSPTTVNVVAGSQTVTATATITDDLSGVSSASISFASPSANQTVFGSFFHTTGDSYQATVTIPQHAAEGAWRPSSVSLYDNTGNFKTLSNSQLQAAGIDVSFTVTSEPDTTAPTLTALSISPASVDASSGPQSVTVTATITDDIAGVQGGYLNLGPVDPLPGSDFPSSQNVFGFFQPKLSEPGTYQATVSIPRYAQTSTWRVNSMTLSDKAGNNRYLSSFDLQSAGLNPSLAVTSTPQDVTGPTLTAFSITPTDVDVTADSATVKVTATVTDDLAGVQSGFIQFYSPTFIQNSYASFQHTTGNQYEADVTIRRFAQAGHWTPSLYFFDNATNIKSFSNSDLQDLGFSNTLIGVSKTVTCPDASSCTTDEEGDGATPVDPVETGVTATVSGNVDIEITPRTTDPPPGFFLIDTQINITAPPATVSDPLRIVFTLDSSVTALGTIDVFKDGVAVPDCTPLGSTTATPDPCVTGRETVGDDLKLTVLSSSASAWNFGVKQQEDCFNGIDDDDDGLVDSADPDCGPPPAVLSDENATSTLLKISLSVSRKADASGSSLCE